MQDPTTEDAQKIIAELTSEVQTPTGKQVMLPRAARCEKLHKRRVEVRGIEPLTS